MPVNGDRWVFEFYSEDFRRLGQQTVAVDLEPAWECARLELLRQGRAGAGRVAAGRAAADQVAAGQVATGRVVPRWSARLGPPYIEGFRIAIASEDPVGMDFPNAYFKSAAQRAAERYVDEGALRAQESFHYLVMFSRSEEGEAEERLPLTIRRQPVTLPLVQSALESYQAGALLRGIHDRADLPVFLPADLLGEVKDLTRRANGSECGGVLLGHLHRDRTLPELFVEVAVQVPARHVEASAARLTFTPETWRDVDAARALRAHGEIMVGWWHSHPVGTWCRDCSPEARHACSLAEGFLSEHDRHLQRTVFPGAHCVALVVTDLGDGEPTCTLFGWRRGQMARRGYFVRSSPVCRRKNRARATASKRTQPEGVHNGRVGPTECRFPAQVPGGPPRGPRDDHEPPGTCDGAGRAAALSARHVRPARGQRG